MFQRRRVWYSTRQQRLVMPGLNPNFSSSLLFIQMDEHRMIAFVRMRRQASHSRRAINVVNSLETIVNKTRRTPKFGI